MIKRVALLTLIALSITACYQTIPVTPVVITGTPVVIPTSKLPAIVSKIQAQVVSKCAGFLPTYSTVVSVMKTFTGPEIDAILAGSVDIATGICEAANGGVSYASRLSTKNTARGKYRNVRIRGKNIISR